MRARPGIPSRMHYILLVTALVFNASANILMKLGAERMQAEGTDAVSLPLIERGLALASNWQLMLGLVLFASNVVFYVLALRDINLSIAYPIMTAGGVLIISIFTTYYLREHLTMIQIGGIVMIAIGIVMLASGLKD